MKLLLGLVVIAAGALGLAEVALPPTIEQVVAQRVEAAGLGQRDVEVTLTGFPVVARALATGDVERVVVRLDEVDTGPLTFATVVADVRGSVIEREALLDGALSFESVDGVELSGAIEAEEVSRLLPPGMSDLTLRPGEVSVTVAGQRLTAGVSASGGVLTVTPAGLGSLDLPLPGGELFPCALGGEVADGVVRVSCTLDEVPPWLLEEASVDLDG